MPDKNQGYNPTAEQQQDMDNLSFDRKYRVNAVENIVENEAGTDIVRMKQPMKDTTATDGSQKTQIVDSSNVNIPIATTTKQDSILTELQQKTEPTDVQLAELIPLFRALLLAIANPSYVDKSANQMRAQVTGSLTTVTTVTTVTNLTNIGTFGADHLQRMANITAWTTNVRNLIT